MPWWAFTPFVILGVLVLLFGLLAILGRFRGGKYLRPIVMKLQKIPIFKRWFMKASISQLERQNPELAGAMKKIQAFGEPKSPEQAQRMLNLLTPSERRAYMAAVEEEGTVPEPTNRQQRRRIEHGGAGMPSRTMTASTRPGAAGRKTGKPKKKR
ncbi:MAG: hypothetical protein U0R50_17505 [Gaiellales bacterium]